MLNKTLFLEIDKPNYVPIYTVQYDYNSRFYEITILNNSQPLDLTGIRVIVGGKKPDGKEVFNSCKVLDAKKGLIQLELTEQMNAVNGASEYALELFSADGMLSSQPFKLIVTRSTISKSVESSKELGALKDALNEVQDIDNRFAQTNAQLSELANKGTTVEVLERVTKEEIDRQIADGTIANLTIANNSITNEKLATRSVKPENCTFFNDGMVDLYDPADSAFGGLHGNGTDASEDGYSRTGYIPVNNGESGNGLQIVINDPNATIPAVYGFLYEEKGGVGVKVTANRNSQNQWVIDIVGDYKYFRMNDISATAGSYQSFLKVFVNGKPNANTLSKYDIDERYIHKSKYESDFEIESVLDERFDGVNIAGGLNGDGSDANTDGYARSNYIRVYPGETITIEDTNKRLKTPYFFLYEYEGQSTGYKVTDFIASNSELSYFQFVIPSGKNYLRLVTVSKTAGDYSEGLSIRNDNGKVGKIKMFGVDLDDRYVKKSDMPTNGGGNNGESGVVTNKLPRPSNGVVNFTVNLNTNLNHEGGTLAITDNYVEMEDNAILLLPTNYNANGDPIRLVINCHGAGTTITSSSTSLSMPVDYFVKGLGYAVLDVNGVPKSLSNNSGLHYGSPLALQSYIKAYRYVIDKYNIKSDGCFVCGTSMGGLTSFMLVQSGSIPVLAQAGICPVVDHFKQAYCNPWNSGASQRSQIAKLFGFTGTEPTWTSSNYPSDAEIQYYMDNIDKVQGYNPMMKNVMNWNSIKPYSLKFGSSEEREGYSQLVKYHPVPLKIWHNDDDTTVVPRYSEFLVNAIRNSGGLAYLRKFPSGAHNAWDNGDSITTTTFDGKNYTVKASGYEIGLWFKRFDI